MPARALHPGLVLKGELEELGITPTEFARQIDVPPNCISQIISGKRAITGDARISREALSVYGYIAYGGRLKPGPGDSLGQVAKFRQQVIETVGDGVLLCPLLLSRPLRHGATWLPLMQIPMAVPFNMAGLPVVMVPVYWTANGLPLSVQVVAGEGQDELALAAAAALESRLGGWKPVD